MPHRAITPALLLSGAILLGGCAEHGPSVHMVTAPAPPPGLEVVELTALLYGRFVVEASCLRLEAGSTTTYTPIFPHGFSLAESDGELVILDATGSRWAPVGEALRMGGGEAGRTNPYGDDANCPPPYWLVSSSAPSACTHTPSSSPLSPPPPPDA